MIEPIVLVHGGAGDITDPAKIPILLAGVKAAALEGYRKLQETGCVLDAVEYAVRNLEDNENFNAGKGSVINTDGEVEMDASIQCGKTLDCGAVTIVKDVKNCITLARKVMENTEHTILGAEGARRFAIDQGLDLMEPGELVTERRIEDLKRILAKRQEPKCEMGTVGSVAINAKGNLAAATSTGGREGKMPGRCSDTSQIGSGTFADDAIGCVSTTGHGESIMKVCLAYNILENHKAGMSIQDATKKGVNDMTAKVGNTAGAIAISHNGEVGVGFSSNRMSWAYIKGNEVHFGVDQDQHDIETITI